MATAKHYSDGVLKCDQQRSIKVIPKRLLPAIAILTVAANYAKRTSGNVWDFAVEIDQLRELGLTNNDLRYLVKRQYVEHAAEVQRSDGRQFEREAELCFTNKSCFVLSRNAPKLRLRSSTSGRDQHNSVADRIGGMLRGQKAVPVWDAARRVLVFRGQIVKQFKCHAANQEVILSAFQEDGWPARIDDPLPPAPALDARHRLSEAVKSLNRHQRQRLIHFRGDGTGQGVIWEA